MKAKSPLSTIRAVLVAQMRSGSTFTIQALGGHPDIRTPIDYELLLDNGPQRRSTYMVRSGGDPISAIEAFYDDVDRSIARAGIFKMTYVQLRPDIINYFKRNGFKVIHQYRRDLVGLTISAFINQLFPDRPGHTLETLEIQTFTARPDQFAYAMQHFGRQARNTGEFLRRVFGNVLEITYEDVTGGQVEATEIHRPTADKIQDFLGVAPQALSGDFRRVNGYPPDKIVENWQEVKMFCVQKGLI